jgi:glycine dehydrogenase subunit 1
MVGIYLALHGQQGLRKLAELNYSKTVYAKERIAQIPGFELAFSGPHFNEFVIRCDETVAELKKRLEEDQILPGISLGRDYPGLEDGLLVCVTEQNTKEQIDRLITALAGGEQ